MKKEKLLEVIALDRGSFVFEKEEKNPNIIGKLKYVFGVWNEKNGNDRTYRSEDADREVGKMREKITQSRVPGMLEHPEDALGDLKGISHIITDVRNVVAGNRKFGIATSAILNTQAGRDLRTLIDEEIPMGASMRSVGNVDEDGTVKDWELITIDAVQNPAFGAQTKISRSNLIESGNEYVECDENGICIKQEYKDKLSDLTGPRITILTSSPSGGELRKILEQENASCSCEEKIKVEKVEKIENLEALTKAYPEFTQELIDNTKKEVEKTLEEKIKNAVDKAVAEAQEKFKAELTSELQPKIKELEKNQTTTIQGIRDAAGALLELPGVVEKTDEDNKGDTKPKVEVDTETKEVVASLKQKISELEDGNKAREKAETEAKAEAKLQVELTEALNTELEKEENKPYAEMIREDVTVDGKILIEKVEDVEGTVTAMKDKVAKRSAELVKAKIIDSGIGEKGIVENPDKIKPKTLTEEQVQERFEAAQTSGWEGTKEDYIAKVLKPGKLVE